MKNLTVVSLELVIVGIEIAFVLFAAVFLFYFTLIKKKKPEPEPLCVQKKKLGKQAQRAADNFETLFEIHNRGLIKYCDEMMIIHPEDKLYYNNLKLLCYKRLSINI